MNNTPTHLTALKVSGADALTFLQGQLTNDIRLLQSGEHQLNAYCNRQGRVLALIDVSRVDDNYFLTLPQELIATIKPLLEKYIVISKVKIDEAEDAYVKSINQDVLLEQMQKLIPFIGLAQSGLFLPHPLGLIELGAVSFNKGCFVGQEIIARMQHRTTNTKSLHYVEIEHSSMPNIGETLDSPQYPKGIIVNAVKIYPNTYAILMILDSKMLYNTEDKP